MSCAQYKIQRFDKGPGRIWTNAWSFCYTDNLAHAQHKMRILAHELKTQPKEWETKTNTQFWLIDRYTNETLNKICIYR